MIRTNSQLELRNRNSTCPEWPAHRTAKAPVVASRLQRSQVSLPTLSSIVRWLAWEKTPYITLPELRADSFASIATWRASSVRLEELEIFRVI
ncbi:hypothetical protein RGR602_PB00116 (plasmid) [Rhizobium gallicum bv. gallicum R602sp]|uniref:Uncharacterized protein n=1 Tax=Rhizobium gallicum bv. gallicum R602sp TaxID=1041138 RepID=A0A0B4XA72_9HYPH|nr:hypothetical protein RGR602_PB00116 [Rhizobium gallicum bv. gallicum R602sp]